MCLCMHIYEHVSVDMFVSNCVRMCAIVCTMLCVFMGIRVCLCACGRRSDVSVCEYLSVFVCVRV